MTCPECMQTYTGRGGGHCRGGAYGGCCQTFANDDTADRHRIGSFEPRHQRRCLTQQEMLEKGWRLTGKGWTRFAEMTPEQVARKRGG